MTAFHPRFAEFWDHRAHRGQLVPLGRWHRKLWDRSSSNGRSPRTPLRLTSQPRCVRICALSSTAFSVDDPCVVYNFQTIAVKKIRMRSTSPYQRVRIDPEARCCNCFRRIQKKLMYYLGENIVWAWCNRAIAHHFRIKVLGYVKKSSRVKQSSREQISQ